VERREGEGVTQKKKKKKDLLAGRKCLRDELQSKARGETNGRTQATQGPFPPRPSYSSALHSPLLRDRQRFLCRFALAPSCTARSPTQRLAATTQQTRPSREKETERVSEVMNCLLSERRGVSSSNGLRFGVQSQSVSTELDVF